MHSHVLGPRAEVSAARVARASCAEVRRIVNIKLWVHMQDLWPCIRMYKVRVQRHVQHVPHVQTHAA